MYYLIAAVVDRVFQNIEVLWSLLVCSRLVFQGLPVCTCSCLLFQGVRLCVVWCYRACERADIAKHMAVHDEPRYACPVCGKAFRHAKNRDLHVKRYATKTGAPLVVGWL